METGKNLKKSEIIEQVNDFPSQEEEELVEFEKNQAETDFQALNREHKKREFRKKYSKRALLLVVVVVLLGALLFLFLNSRKNNDNSVAKVATVEIPKDADHAFINDVSGVQEKTEDVTKGNVSAEIAGVSENYRIRDIAVGGGNIVLAATTESLPLKVSDVHSETLMSKDGKKIQLLLSWKTNKLAKSEVGYSSNTKGTEKKIKDDGYGFSHALVLNSLEPSTRYLFTVRVSDRSGNVVNSDTLAVYTGSKPISVFDLISNQMNDIFGWALKK